MDHNEYYAECVLIAASECGIDLTQEQATYIGDAVLGAVENFSMAYGYDVASSNLRASQAREQDELRQRLHYEQTVPRNRCNTCKGHGFSRDGWGREFGCRDCDGVGSTPAFPFQYSASGVL